MSFRLFDSIILLFKGILMGAADIVPGISGGTIAMMTGIYEQLIKKISNIKFSFLIPLIHGDFKLFIRKIKDEIDFIFFIPLLLGIAISFLVLSNIINYLLKTQTAYVYSFFIGLIFASAYILYQKLKLKDINAHIFLILGLILSYIFVGLNPIASNHDIFTIFFSGLIAICAMILPGISGSMILLLLNQYDYMINALHSFNLQDIFIFLIGALIGILSFSKFLNYLLSRYETLTISFLIGVMIGTLRKPFLEISTHLPITWYYCIIPVIIGFLLIFILEKFAVSNTKN